MGDVDKDVSQSKIFQFGNLISGFEIQDVPLDQIESIQLIHSGFEDVCLYSYKPKNE
jgi:hypothetical protein